MTAARLAAKAQRAVRASARLARCTPAPKAKSCKVAPVIPIDTKLIRAITEAQLGICPYCDDWLEFDPDFGISHPLRPSIDHVMPRSLGGQSVGNKLVMHRECNTLKGNRLPNGCERIWLAAVNARLGF